MNWLSLLERSLAIPDFDVIASRTQLVPAQRAFLEPPDNARIAAVMVLFYTKEGELTVVFGKRPYTLRNHPGQIAFPGGKHESNETLADTALRETLEEVGVLPRQIRMLGRLDPLYIPPSNFFIHPFVGWCGRTPEFKPDPREVAEVIEVPITHFMDPGNFQIGPIQTGGGGWSLPYYQVGDDQLWGATATILCEMVTRLERIWPEETSP